MEKRKLKALIIGKSRTQIFAHDFVAITKLTSFLQPVLLIVVAVIILFIILAIMAPIMRLYKCYIETLSKTDLSGEIS